MGLQAPTQLPEEREHGLLFTKDGHPLYKVEEAARKSGVEAGMIRYWLKQGIVSVTDKGFYYQRSKKDLKQRPLFDQEELDAFLIAAAVYTSPRGCRTSWVTHEYERWLKECRRSQRTSQPTTAGPQRLPSPPAAPA